MAVQLTAKLLFLFGYVVNVLGNNDSKVIGGELAPVIPFIVSVQQYLEHHCGGSLLTLSNVLLACHCFSGFNIYQKMVNVTNTKIFRVVAGHTDLETKSKYQQIREVKSFLKHPRCWFGGRDPPKYDLALIVTKSSFRTSANVKEIKLYSMNKKSLEERFARITEKTDCWTAGWGMTVKGSDETSRYLKILKLRFVPYSKCRSMMLSLDPRFKTIDIFKNGQICAQAVKKFDIIYGGDSGGPLVCDGQLVGVSSYFLLRTDNDMPIVFAKVSEFTEWYGGIAHRSVDSSAPVQQIGLVFLVMINLVEIETL
ncbi:Hypothetical protein NTJ_15388 [Nesidiocoris tenuis]|uniref:Peptidase S1 domain-containing protein n=1 Tax=Nesidiocoris tenuis TaxID=355587 RepID=A0ABN7BFY4_9HEMI|nr:Hypothetical protein NTJ_15388 [Nesidiocoris tenuis]